MKDSETKIFLIDDDELFLTYLEKNLKQYLNCVIDFFINGELCLLNLAQKPDVIILDYSLNSLNKSAKNGLEVLTEIKSSYPNIPIIMLSAYDEIEIAAKCIHYGAIDYLVKSETIIHNLIKAINISLELKILKQKTPLKVKQLETLNQNISNYNLASDKTHIVSIVNQNGIFVNVNQYFCKISKYKKNEITGHHHKLLNSGYHSNEFIKNIMTTIKSGLIWKGEIKNKAKDGTSFWVDTTIIPILNKKDKSEKYLSLQSNITEHKNFIKEFESSEKNYEDIYQNSQILITSYNIITSKVLEINDIGVKMFGYKSKKDFIQNFQSSNHFSNSKYKKIFLEKLLQNKEINNKLITVKKLDGTAFLANLFLKLNLETNIVTIVAINVTKEIHYHRELENKVNEKALELSESLIREKELNEMKSRFVSNASHEFRTPLSAILSSAYLIEQYTKTSQQEKRKIHLNRIYSSIKNLTDILNNFISIDAIDNNNHNKENYTRFNLSEFLKMIVEEIEPSLINKQQRIVFHHTGNRMVTLPKKILQSIIINLLSNASKYSDQNSEIHLITQIDSTKILITVKDFGIGIPEEEQKKLFTEFFRAKNAENIQGTGLGLNIVKKQVELLNGNLIFFSKVNEGTSFTIKIPQFKISTN